FEYGVELLLRFGRLSARRQRDEEWAIRRRVQLPGKPSAHSTQKPCRIIRQIVEQVLRIAHRDEGLSSGWIRNRIDADQTSAVIALEAKHKYGLTTLLFLCFIKGEPISLCALFPQTPVA